MISTKKHSQGFTIVELLIVIVVIGILALLVISTYSGIQAKSRNNTRQNDIKGLQSQIEAFFSQNGYYPNLTDLNSASWRASNMKSLTASYLVDPSSSCNPATSKCLVPAPIAKSYSYQATQSDGSTSCDGPIGNGADQNCAEYTLTATYEGSVNGSSTFAVKNQD